MNNNYVQACNCDKVFGEYPCPIHDSPKETTLTSTEGKGEVKLWGSGDFEPPTYVLGVDDDGNIVEAPIEITSDGGITVTDPNVKLGGTLLELGGNTTISEQEMKLFLESADPQILKIEGTTIPIGEVDLSENPIDGKPEWVVGDIGDMDTTPLLGKIGTSGQILKSIDGVPTWVECDTESLIEKMKPAQMEANQRMADAQLYFTPSIEDIHVGYECETRALPYPHWVSTKIEDEVDFEYILGKEWEIRVPYLTKEQIEKEGWVPNPMVEGGYWEGVYKASKGGYGMDYAEKHHAIRVAVMEPYKQIYEGECKDINTLRYICKLLNI